MVYYSNTPMQTILTSPRILIRQFAENEADLLLNMNADERIARFIPRRTPAETRALFAQMLKDYNSNPQLGRWAMFSLQGNDFVGLCMLIAARPGLSGIEIGYSLNHKYWGQGLATEAVKAVIEYAFNTLNLNAVCAITTADNSASQNVLIKAGFEAKGTVLLNDGPKPYYRIANNKL
jgi:ribosomal-protein-alanine N-acetyltransferase